MNCVTHVMAHIRVVNPIIIHNLDRELKERLEAFADREGLSVVHAVERILRDRLRVAESTQSRRSDFERFSGLWTTGDQREFDDAVERCDDISAGW